MNKKLILVISIILMVLVFLMVRINKQQKTTIDSFEDCVAASYPVMESYPERCSTPDGKTFTNNIGNELELFEDIQLVNPRPNQLISSPIEITGKARGNWFFEASFPVEIYDSKNKLLGSGIAEAKSDWMTEDFVPFQLTLEFSNPNTKNGELVLKKDNPSGLPEYDQKLVVPVNFSK